jgi:hypothetical protein
VITGQVTDPVRLSPHSTATLDTPDAYAFPKEFPSWGTKPTLALTDDVDANVFDVSASDDCPTSNVASALNVSPDTDPEDPELNCRFDENVSPDDVRLPPDCTFSVQLFESVDTVTPLAMVSDPADATYNDDPYPSSINSYDKVAEAEFVTRGQFTDPVRLSPDKTLTLEMPGA